MVSFVMSRQLTNEMFTCITHVCDVPYCTWHCYLLCRFADRQQRRSVVHTAALLHAHVLHIAVGASVEETIQQMVRDFPSVQRQGWKVRILLTKATRHIVDWQHTKLQLRHQPNHPLYVWYE